MRKNKKVTIISLAIAGMLAVATAFTGLFSGTGVKNTAAATVTVGTPAHDAALSVALSSEEFYRLLYVNDVEQRNDVALAFQASGYDAEDIEYLKNGLDLRGKANIGLLVLNTVTSALAKKSPGSFIASASTVGKIVKTFNTMSSVYQINMNNEEMFNKLSGELEDVYGAISKDIANQTDLLQKDLTNKTTYLADTFKQQAYAETLTEFNTKAFKERVGTIQNDVGYYRWKELLLNKYSTLQSRMSTNASSTLIQEAYDLLYEIATQNTVLYDYMLGGTYSSGEDVSIQEILYRYNLLRWKNESGYAIEQGIADCIEFTEELYNTYLFSQTCLAFCYQYQAESVGETMGETDIFENMSYYLFNYKDAPDKSSPVVFSETLMPFLRDPLGKAEQLSKELCNYFVRILNLEQVYGYSYGSYATKKIYNEISTVASYNSTVVNTQVGEQAGYYRSINDNVKKGSTLYLSSIPTALTQNLEAELSFQSSDESKATVNADGSVTVVGTSGAFTVSLLANGAAIYTMEFTIGGTGNLFSGGLGTAESPYLIATEADLKTLAQNSSCWSKCYEMYNDITLTSSIGQIGSYSTPFTGSFDGNGYSIKNVTSRALFAQNDGFIEDLTLEGSNVTTGYAIYASLYTGGLVEYNNGTIKNCRFLNGTVDISHTPSMATLNSPSGGYYTNVSVWIGGIAGLNHGTVSGCEVRGSTIKGYEKNPIAEGGGAPSDVGGYVGALVGCCSGKTLDGLAANNTVYMAIHAVSYRWKIGWTNYKRAYGRFYVGGLVGAASGSTVSRCVGYGNNVTYDFQASIEHYGLSSEDWTDDVDRKDAHVTDKIGSVENATVTYCYQESEIPSVAAADIQVMQSNGWTWTNNKPIYCKNKPTYTADDTSVTVSRLPFKTFYTSGDALNTAGLVLKTNTGKYITDEITFTGFSTSENGTIYVTAEWNGLKTKFVVTVGCQHAQLSQTEIASTLICDERSTTYEYACQDCGDTLNTVEYTRTITHAWNDGEPIVKVGCTTDGSTKFTCTVCSVEETVTVKATGHNYKATVVEPSCLKGGYTTHICENCSDSYVDSEVPAAGHAFENVLSSVEPTCELGGSRDLQCLRCTATTSEDVPKLGHDYLPTIVSPTCTAGGHTEYDCSRCDSAYKDHYVGALGHDYVAKLIGATCTAGGHTEYDCSRCDSAYKDSYVGALGHDFVAKVMDPTCTEQGYTLHDCSRCDETKKDTFVPALDHAWQAGKTVAPNCTEFGYTEYGCTRCTESKQDNFIASLGHAWGALETVDPTCEDKGYTKYGCARCPQTKKDDYVSATGHSLKTEQEISPTCTEKGYTETTYCTEDGCGYVKTPKTEIPATGHDHTATVTQPTCTEQGYTTYTCHCGDTYVADYTDPCHKGEEWIVDKEPTQKETGLRHKECEICGEAFDEEVLEKLPKKGCSGSIEKPMAALLALCAAAVALRVVAKRKREH